MRREEFERKHPLKIREIESQFKQHMHNKFNSGKFKQEFEDHLEKYHMQDVKAVNSDTYENTMLDWAEKEGLV